MPRGIYTFVDSQRFGKILKTFEPMSSRLDRITDWPALAEQVRFNVTKLAKACGVTDRQLRRFFWLNFGTSPHLWMTLRRLEASRPLLSDDQLLKEIATKAGFSHQGNFTRLFKRHYHTPPSAMRSAISRKTEVPKNPRSMSVSDKKCPFRITEMH